MFSRTAFCLLDAFVWHSFLRLTHRDQCSRCVQEWCCCRVFEILHIVCEDHFFFAFGFAPQTCSVASSPLSLSTLRSIGVHPPRRPSCSVVVLVNNTSSRVSDFCKFDQSVVQLLSSNRIPEFDLLGYCLCRINNGHWLVVNLLHHRGLRLTFQVSVRQLVVLRRALRTIELSADVLVGCHEALRP